ncbi:MAG: hypothetical protein LBP89_10590, partial [Helicobacteraceae bacterium]|nr:hypothetical protein [Helicobacteraceae bacterium]
MGKLVILVALCVGALLGDNTITIGEFSIKSTPQKDAMKIEIFKNKKPFQEIIENWESVCDINFLFTGIHSKEEPLAFGAICDGVYSAAEYEFDLKTNKFVYAGAVEEISIQELAQ